RAAVREIDAPGERAGAQGQLRASLRRSEAPGQSVGEGQHQGRTTMSTEEQRAAFRAIPIAALLAFASASPARAQQPPPSGPPTLEIYGFGQADAIVDIEQNNPDWYDVNRPSRLPSSTKEFGQDGHFYLSGRQSRFGARGTLPTSAGDVTATFEFDM